MGFLNEYFYIVKCFVRRVNIFIIRYIIFYVYLWIIIYRVDLDDVDIEIVQIVEFGGNVGKIVYVIVIGIVEGSRVDLVYYSFFLLFFGVVIVGYDGYLMRGGCCCGCCLCLDCQQLNFGG